MPPARHFLANRLLVAAALFLPAALPGTAHAGEAYYLLMFGSQRIPNEPNYAHTFATFVRARWAGDGPCRGHVALEAHTISWLPTNLIIRTRALRPQCGHNFGLGETLRYVLKSEARVSMWGPYEICPDLYNRALKQIARLESGQLKYKANDTGFSANRVSNCIHAVSETVSRPRLIVGSPGWGEVASNMVLRRMRPWILDEHHPHYEISSALGLNCYPLVYRDHIERPISGAVLGPIFRLFGGERSLEATYGPPR